MRACEALGDRGKEKVATIEAVDANLKLLSFFEELGAKAPSDIFLGEAATVTKIIALRAVLAEQKKQPFTKARDGLLATIDKLVLSGKTLCADKLAEAVKQGESLLERASWRAKVSDEASWDDVRPASSHLIADSLAEALTSTTKLMIQVA